MSIKFTLVSTVFNEMGRLDQTIKNLENQTLIPDEIIITDAGSTDGTYERLGRWAQESKTPITILQEKGCNVARGRNLAINAAKYDLIVSTDFGCIHYPDWSNSLVQPFISDGKLEVVGGASSVLESEIATLAQKADYLLNNGYRVIIDPEGTISSRSIAYKKYVWEQLGGYPEWLTLAADDSVFWRLIKKSNYQFFLVKEVKVYWLRHQSFKGFASEAKRYGIGGGETRTNMRNFISHCVQLFSRYGGLILLFLTFFIPISTITLVVLAFLLILFGTRSHRIAIRNWLRLRSDKYNFKVFIVSLYMIERQRFAYILGYLKGIIFSTDQQKQEAKKLQKVLKTGFTSN
jgi:glycosyltransferase involved in cell wall biosynthesis